MLIEAAIILILIFIALQATGSINLNKFIKDNREYFKNLKETDYESDMVRVKSFKEAYEFIKEQSNVED